VNPVPVRAAAVRRFAVALTASASTLLLASCGGVDGSGGGSTAAKEGNDITVGLLLPDKKSTRYEKYDYPLIKERIAALTKDEGKVVYANAEASAAKQNTQMEQMISERADVIVVDPVDAKGIAPAIQRAKDAGIPVVSYDRLAQGPIDAYVAHDNEMVGQLQGRAIIGALGSAAASSKVVVMNGSADDPNAALVKAGAMAELEGRVEVAEQYDTEGGSASAAEKNLTDALGSVGQDDLAAVYAADDDIAGGVIRKLKAAGVDKMPPVTGQDATVSALRRIITGEQNMTVYKSFEQEAYGVADVALAKVRGRGIEFEALTPDTIDSVTQKGVPAMLVQVVAVTQDNIDDTVLADGVYRVSDICSAKYQAECAALGLA
jgi:D-xylose transport system substrate-binding protein